MSVRNFEIERFATIESTNTYLLERARTGAPGGIVAVADHQSAGRGRLDRRWESPPGSSLLVSILLREYLEPGSAHLLTGAVALAGSAAAGSLSGVRPKLKWPNDLVIDGAKLAGILAEADAGATGGEPGTIAVVVGLGMNLTWSGPAGVGGTCLLEASGVDVDRDELLDLLLAELGPRLDMLATSEGRRALADEVAAASATLGQEVSVTTAAGTTTGVATALSAEGHLIVETAAGPVEFITGDVVQLRATPGAPRDAE